MPSYIEINGTLINEDKIVLVKPIEEKLGIHILYEGIEHFHYYKFGSENEYYRALGQITKL